MAPRLRCYHFAALNKAQGLQRCLGCNADPKPSSPKVCCGGSDLSSHSPSICPMPPSPGNHPLEQPCGHQRHRSASLHLSGLTSHSSLSHPVLGPLLGSAHPNTHPACMSTKGHFATGNEQLSTEPPTVTGPGASPSLADDVAAASRARHAWEPAEAREESVQTFHLWRG